MDIIANRIYVCRQSYRTIHCKQYSNYFTAFNATTQHNNTNTAIIPISTLSPKLMDPLILKWKYHNLFHTHVELD